MQHFPDLHDMTGTPFTPATAIEVMARYVTVPATYIAKGGANHD